MKISQNWLKTYIHLDVEPQEMASKLTQSGLEVTGIESHQLFPDGIVVGFVKSCIPHPNADKLKLTTVDIGDGKDYTIVCGAKNIDKGQSVLVATVGTVLPLPNGDSLKIAKRKIRGEASEGMVCSAYELGLIGQEDAIWVLDGKPKVGTEAQVLLNTPQDTIYDLDITPNRNDACSHLGVARELSALFNKNLLNFATHDTIVPQHIHPIQIALKEPNACPRYTAILLDHVKVAPSPVWLQDRLKTIGIQPRNNIVDITNFITHDLGQPIHAFDYDQIEQKKIIIQHLPSGTIFKGLDGIEHTLTGEEIMICDSEKALAMGGIIGGDNSKITPNTKRVVIESAYFNPTTISKTARHHGIHTDASYRFERGTDPHIPYSALHKAVQLMQEMTGGVIASDAIDIYPEKITPIQIETTYHYIEQVVGMPIPRKNIQQILQRLDIIVEKSSDDTRLKVTVPAYRRDVTRPIDLVEEILRIYGYDQVPTQSATPQGFPMLASQDPVLVLKKKIGDFLTVRNFYEIKNNPLMPAMYHQWLKEIDPKKSVSLINPLNENYTTLPQTLLFGGLEAIRHNNNRQEQDLRFFSIAKHYGYNAGNFYEEEYLAIWVTGNLTSLIWGDNQQAFTSKDLQGLVAELLSYLGAPSDWDIQLGKSSIYQEGMTIFVNDDKDDATVTLGQVAPSLLASFQIAQPVFFATAPINQLLYSHQTIYNPIGKYPSLTRDISLAIPQAVLYKDILKVIEKLKIAQLENVKIIDLYEGAALGDKKSYTLRLTLRDAQKTLQEKEVTKILAKVTRSLVKEIGATIRE